MISYLANNTTATEINVVRYNRKDTKIPKRDIIKGTLERVKSGTGVYLSAKYNNMALYAKIKKIDTMLTIALARAYRDNFLFIKSQRKKIHIIFVKDYSSDFFFVFETYSSQHSAVAHNLCTSDAGAIASSNSSTPYPL